MPPSTSTSFTLPDWSHYLEQLRTAGEVFRLTWSPEDQQVRAEVYRQLIMNVALGYFMYFQMNPAHPDWIPFLNSGFLLQPNPDDTYYLSAIDSEGTYRISGERGTVHILTFDLGFEPMGTTDRIGGALGHREVGIDLPVRSDGTFEFVLSPQRPADYDGVWWETPAEARTILARQRSYDWGRERDARFAIERLDMNDLKPRMTAEEIDARLSALMGGFVARLSRMWYLHQNHLLDTGLVNRLEHTGFNGALPVQVYWQGIYRLAPGEALILESTVPENVRYWNVQLNDALWNATEYVHRQSSLNAHQATIDADGKFRAVLSLDDPGVPNWLDPGGYLQGTLVGRWYGADSHPTPTLNVVPFCDLHKHLPADSPTVTALARTEQLRARRVGAQLRRRW